MNSEIGIGIRPDRSKLVGVGKPDYVRDVTDD